jgi:hypothetical protein
MKKKITSADLMAQLNADPEYVSRIKKQDEAIRAQAEELACAEAPLVDELRHAGVPISSIWDLVNSKENYPQLIPILLAHLDRPYPLKVREGIARALAVKESRPFWNSLVERYLAETDTSSNGMKWALHLAIAASADISVLDILLTLVRDKRHGRNRALFVDALARIDDPRAKATLVELADDPDLHGDVQRVIKKATRRKNSL